MTPERADSDTPALLGEGEAGNFIVFLDFDGVITSPRAMVATGQWFDPIATGLIARLWRDYDFSIVVSSTWRMMPKRAQDGLEAHGLLAALHADWRTNEAMAEQAPGSLSRPWELNDWLARNGEPEFAILDDDEFAWDGRQLERWIRCDVMNGMMVEGFEALERRLNEADRKRSPAPTATGMDPHPTRQGSADEGDK